MAQIFHWPKGLPDPDKNSKRVGLTQYESECRGAAYVLLGIAAFIFLVCLLGGTMTMTPNSWRGASLMILGLWTSAMALWNARVMSALICGGFFLALLLLWLSF
jgi:hypothetical protein